MVKAPKNIHVRDYEKFAAALRKQTSLSPDLYDIPTLDELADEFDTLEELMKARKVGPPSIWDKPFWPDPATVPYNVEGSYAKVKPMETNYTAAGSSKETPVVAAVELSSWERMQRFTWNSFEDSESSVFGFLLSMWICFLIVASGIVCVIETVPGWRESEDLWFAFEVFFVAGFTIEFAMRWGSCPNAWDFWTTPMNWIDLIAIAPFYIGVAGGSSDSLKILRLARSFRLLKLSRYSTGFTVVKNALVASSDALQLFVLVLVMVLIVFSSAIYYMERGTWNPDTKYYYRTSNVGYWGDMPPEGTNPSPFQSIPHSFWWCMVTLTTVGYGDVVPTTYMGQLVGAATMLVGLVMLALPLSIIGTNFIEEDQQMKEHINEQKNAWKVEDPKTKVASLKGVGHALAVTQQSIHEAEECVQQQKQMTALTKRALRIVGNIRDKHKLPKAAIKLDEEDEDALSFGLIETPLSPNLSPGGNKLRRMSSGAVQEARTKVVNPEGFQPGEGEKIPTVKVEAIELQKLDEIFAEIIAISQSSMDIWDMEMPQVK